MLTNFLTCPLIDVSCEEFEGNVALETFKIRCASVDPFVFLRNLFKTHRSANEFQSDTHFLDVIYRVDPTFNVKTSSILEQDNHRKTFMLKVTDAMYHERITNGIERQDFARVQSLVDELYFRRVSAASIDTLLNPEMFYYEYAVRDSSGLYYKKHCYVRIINHNGQDILGMDLIHKHCLMQIYRCIYDKQYDMADVFFNAYTSMFPAFTNTITKVRDVLDSVPRDDVRLSRVRQNVDLLIRLMQSDVSGSKSNIANFYYMIARSISSWYESLPLNYFRTNSLKPTDVVDHLLQNILVRLKFSKWTPDTKLMYDAYFCSI